MSLERQILSVLEADLPPHPRLLLNAARWAELREQIKTDVVSARLFEVVRTRAEWLLPEPPVAYIKEGFRLLTPIREGLGRIICLAVAANLTGDDRFVQRAVEELRTAANLNDWNPQHFLDTAEMTLGMAIGYDWLFDRLSEADRELIEQALIGKGVRASFDSPPHYLGWVHGTNNWSQVCNAGITAGALAADHLSLEWKQRVLQRMLDDIPVVAACAYAPEGVYPEGPNYWAYGTSFHVILIDILRSVLGTSFALEESPGFLASSGYMAQMTAPSGIFYNYSDARPDRPFQPALFWFSREQQQTGLAQNDIAQIEDFLRRVQQNEPLEECRFFPLALIWWKPVLTAGSTEASLPLCWKGNGEVPVATLRTAWEDPKAVFVAIKGGRPNYSHGHMDVGSFVLEADGVRWAVDLGMQEYFLLESARVNLWESRQGGERWKVFRLGPDSHSILRFDGKEPRFDAESQFSWFDAPSGRAILDLTALYSGSATSVHRGIALRADRRVLLQDEWTVGDSEVEVVSQWMTQAKVTVKDDLILLDQASQTLQLSVLEPAGVKIEVEDASQPVRSYDAPNPGLSRILFRMHHAAGSTGRLVLLAEPASATSHAPVLVQPLADWKSA